jgi:hypothetical protein
MVLSYDGFFSMPILNIAGILKIFFLHFAGMRPLEAFSLMIHPQRGLAKTPEGLIVPFVDRGSEPLYHKVAFATKICFSSNSRCPYTDRPERGAGAG